MGMGAVVVGVVVLLTGCGSEAPRSTYTPTVTIEPSASAAPSASATPSGHFTSPASPVGTPTPIASTDPNRPSGQCADDVLKVALSRADAGAGNIDQDIVFTNTGSGSCVLRGAPGVSAVGDGNGTQLGAPATRSQTGAKDVELAANGGTATAHLHSVNIDSGGGPLGSACAAKQADGLRIYPPHSTVAVFVKESVYACTSGTAWMKVASVVSG